MRVIRIPVVLFLALLTGIGAAQVLPNKTQELIGYITLGDVRKVDDILRSKPSMMNSIEPNAPYPPLHVLMSLKASTRMLDTVFEYKFDLNQKVKGETPLSLGVAAGNVPAVQRLLAAGAKANVKSGDGNNALHLAVGTAVMDSSKSLEMIQALLEGGVDPNALDKSGRPPLMLALGLASKNDELAAKIVTALLAGGANKDLVIVIKDKKVPLSKMMEKAPPKTLKAYQAAT